MLDAKNGRKGPFCPIHVHNTAQLVCEYLKIWLIWFDNIVLRRTGEIMLTGGTGDESGVLLLSGEMWIKRNPLPQRVSSTHTLTQCHNSLYLIDTKVMKI